MSIDLSQTPRAGKYCPRCHAMMPRAQAACTQCGHRFRTGTDSPEANAAPKEADLLNRTMQFTLPPLPSRSVAPAAPPRAVPLPGTAFLPATQQSRAFWAASGIVVLLGIGTAFLWHARTRAASAEASPTGIWETTLHGRAASSARLEFALSADGTGRLSWSEPGQSGRVPLRWRVNPDKTLSLTLTPKAGSDATSQTLAGLWSSHPWPWRRDTKPDRLILGTLIMTEKP